jgi:Cu/Ag efflux protein CusF
MISSSASDPTPPSLPESPTLFPMNTRVALRTLLSFTAASAVAFAAAGKNCGCSCCKDRPKGVACCCNETEPAATPTKAADTIKRHPLKGVVTSVLAERSALMVKHEEIPDVMRAMTMLFKVDAATLKSAQKGQTITAQMSRQGSDWVLEDVKVIAGK